MGARFTRKNEKIPISHNRKSMNENRNLNNKESFLLAEIFGTTLKAYK